MNTWSGWRVATRLARREVRRRWGRTLLVMMLVAVPVFGMTMITTLVRTAHDTPSRQFKAQFGSANLAAIGTAPTPSGGWPAGTQITRGREVSDIGVLAANGVARLANVTDFDLNNPVTKGAVLLREGRFPAKAGEALVSPRIARAFGLRIGSELRLAEPAWSEHIVGIGELATNWNDGLIAVRGNELQAQEFQSSTDLAQQYTLVKLPGRPSQATLQHYGSEYFSANSPTADNTTKAVNWTLVGGLIALAISGIVISGAFAVGARRQLVTLGQLSANGAAEGLLKRMLSLQGAFCGALGTGLGIGAGVVTLTLMHAHFNNWIHRDIGPFVWSPRDLVAISITGVLAATVAAYFPARSAARVPVLHALAGRRPLGALPRSIVPVGIALFGGGVLVLSLVAAASRNGGGNNLAAAAVFGGLLVLAGACCVSPVVVASLARVGRHARGAGRVALRSIVRSRARSAAVVMALAAINGGAIAIGTAFASRTEHGNLAARTMPDNALELVHHTFPSSPDETPTLLPIEPSVEHTLRTILPKATWHERRAVAGTVNTPVDATPGGTRGTKRIYAMPGPDGIVVADPAILAVVGLSSSDLATLERTGVMVLPQPDLTDNSPVSVTVGEGASAKTVPAARPKHRVRADAGIQALITAAEAQRLHVPVESAGAIVTNPTAFDESQRASIDALTPTIMFGSASAPDQQPSEITDLIWSGPRSTGISPDIVREIILAIVVVIALIVLAMSLALSAAETRDERDVLVSLGAPPRTMRGVAAWKAASLSFTGAALAIPTGFIPVAVAYYAAVRPGDSARLAFPWLTVFELLLVAPLIAAVVAGAGSAIAQRVRPTQMSTFATD